ncbi:hypothetical protein BJ912DRAFT_101664 [Pholiota molesta]|nr:hypothetical protein BJ912DRAFT_101664 [Pholiota molesta]
MTNAAENPTSYMALSKPLLPPEFIKEIESQPMMKGFKSQVYSTEAHTARLAMRNWTKPESPNCTVELPNGADGFTKAAKRTYVHLHAMEGDILALCERLRCGANPDQKDSDGITPIDVCMRDMLTFFIPGVYILNHETNQLYTAAETERNVARCTRVVRILVEQHADVNGAAGGRSLLDMACSMKNWEIITLLLEHGAKMTLPRSVVESCFTRDEQALFYGLVTSKSLPLDQPRPAKMCPCWSGKPLHECHANRHSYPLEFMCICGSAKIYKKCCLLKTPVSEKWDDEHQRIVHYLDSTGQEQVPPPSHNAKLLEANKMVATLLLMQNSIDPAFAYAMERHIWYPRIPTPRDRKTFSRSIQEGWQKGWNALIDEYIDKGIDNRSRFDIERAAKTSVWGGALIRTCEGDGCSKVEQRDVASLKYCTKCHIAVYCSPICQKSVWPTHKQICGKAEQRPQLLASQISIQAFQREALSEIEFELTNLDLD